MEHFIVLNLSDDTEKAEAENLPRPEDNGSVEREKRLNRFANMAAHKAAKEFAHGRFGIFSK
jgi:hypothetical protein